MLWEVEVRSLQAEDDGPARSLMGELTSHAITEEVQTSRVFLLDGDLSSGDVESIARKLLVDTSVESSQIHQPNAMRASFCLTVLPKPGVMDPAAASVEGIAADLGFKNVQVRTGWRYYVSEKHKKLATSLISNEAVEHCYEGSLTEQAWKAAGSPYSFELITVPILQASDSQLSQISKTGGLALNLEEMRTIQQHFAALKREPTDVELESIAQTWSEHCSHKTLKGRISYTGPDGERIEYKNMLKETIFAATQKLRKQWGTSDWCVSVFADNAGVVKFSETHHVCFKVETHNRPSAIEPFGGASTGIGGVIRDVLGTGMGGRPVANTDVFCFAPPTMAEETLPPGVLPPRQVMQGVVGGVKEYGNQIGIPTINGAIHFDERYVGNPLVFCGTVGLIPVGMESKAAQPGDYIVAVGGRTGRDGIHGATFSSEELTHQSEKLSGGAVQIGNAITEKKVIDVILAARDQKLYTAITDCGAGGFSSAVGEMGADLGARVKLDSAPLKYQGLSYTEIWISEAQERMVLSVPPDNWPRLQKLCESEGVEAVVLGCFEATGKLVLEFQGKQVGELDMHFLHDGRPETVRQASWPAPQPAEARTAETNTNYTETLKALLAVPTIASKEAVIRRYDHEVQGASVIKSLVGVQTDGPGDASVIAPEYGSQQGIAVGCGLCPQFGDVDPYWMALAAVDEALRNVVSVGADPKRVAILDNFCWANTDRPEILGSLVRAAQGCHDAAMAFGTPFISGKDSLKNEFTGPNGLRIVPPPTLLISAMGLVPNVLRCCTMDLKKPGNKLFLLGLSKEELGGSQIHLLEKRAGGAVPQVDLKRAPLIFTQLHEAIRHQMVVACHDLSEGGLAVALAEMCFAGGHGAVIETTAIPQESELTNTALLFGESTTRFLLEVPFEWERSLAMLFEGLPFACIGKVTDTRRMTVFSSVTNKFLVDADIGELKTIWQKPLKNLV